MTLQAGVTRYVLRQKNFDSDSNLSGIAGLKLWLPNASALFWIGRDRSIYFTYAKSAGSGGSVGGTYVNAGAQLPAIPANTYKAGTKLQLVRLQLTAAAYTYTQPSRRFVKASVTFEY